MRPRLAAIVASVALAGCSDGASAVTPERIVTFGHSFVQGGYPDPLVTPWPDRVAAELGVALSNRGVAATESPAIAATVEDYVPRSEDVVAVEPALNDVRHRGRRGLPRYRRSLRRILGHVVHGNEHPTVELLIDPPIVAWRRHRPYNRGTRRILHAYARATRAVAARYAVRVVDLGRGWDPALQIGPDGVHPNEAGTARIADLVERGLA